MLLSDDMLSEAKLLNFGKVKVLLYQGNKPSGGYRLVKGRV